MLKLNMLAETAFRAIASSTDIAYVLSVDLMSRPTMAFSSAHKIDGVSNIETVLLSVYQAHLLAEGRSFFASFDMVLGLLRYL